MDIYDISWCPNSQFLVSSGTDSNMIIWDIQGTRYTCIQDHSGYIQGVEWTRDDSNIITVSNDRTARVYSFAKGRVNPALQIENYSPTSVLKNDFRLSKNIINNKSCKE